MISNFGGLQAGDFDRGVCSENLFK